MLSRSASAWWAVVPLASVLAGPAAAGTPAVSLVVDLSGRAVDPLPARGAGPTVLVFTRTDCPLSNRYAPTLRRLHDRFASRGASFWLVYPDGTEPVDAIRRHGRDFGFGFPALRDPDHALVALTGATVTPEAAVFVPDAEGPRMVYRGRIDDRAVEVGRTRPRATTRDLEQVLEALAAGGTVTPRTTAAVGCFIAR
jgi:AhpC/TSA family protein